MDYRELRDHIVKDIRKEEGIFKFRASLKKCLLEGTENIDHADMIKHLVYTTCWLCEGNWERVINDCMLGYSEECEYLYQDYGANEIKIGESQGG